MSRNTCSSSENNMKFLDSTCLVEIAKCTLVDKNKSSSSLSLHLQNRDFIGAWPPVPVTFIGVGGVCFVSSHE